MPIETSRTGRAEHYDNWPYIFPALFQIRFDDSEKKNDASIKSACNQRSVITFYDRPIKGVLVDSMFLLCFWLVAKTK